MRWKKIHDPTLAMSEIISDLNNGLELLGIWSSDISVGLALAEVDRHCLRQLTVTSIEQNRLANKTTNTERQLYQKQISDIQNILGLCVEWCIDRLPSTGTGKYDLLLIQELWEFAYNYHDLANISIATRNGYYDVYSTKIPNYISIRPRHITHEALNVLISSAAHLEQTSALIPEKAKTDTNGESAIESLLFAELVNDFRRILDENPHDIYGLTDEDMNIGGIEVSEAKRLWLTLAAILAQNLVSNLETKTYGIIRLGDDVEDLAAGLHEVTGIEIASIKLFLKLIVYDATQVLRDVCVTPIFKLSGGLFSTTALMHLYNLERNLIRMRLERTTGGGRQLGRLGEEMVVRSISALPSVVNIKSNVPLISKGKHSTELDVVVWDTVTRQGLILEVKWTASLQGYKQTSRRDDIIYKAQIRHDIRRVSVENSALDWPDDLPIYSSIDWTWMVVCTSGMPSKENNLRAEIQATSLDYLEYLLHGPVPVQTLGELVKSLAQPRLPAGWKPILLRETYRVGAKEVSVEYIDFEYNTFEASLAVLMAALSADRSNAFEFMSADQANNKFAFLSPFQFRPLHVKLE